MFTGITSKLLGVSTFVLAIALGVQTYRIALYDAEVSKAQLDVKDAQKQVSDLNAKVSDTIASNERVRADQEKKNSDIIIDLSRKADTLQATLNQKQADYNKVSAQLRGIITNAPREDSRELGPTMLKYFDGLRKQQQEWHGNNIPVTAGND